MSGSDQVRRKADDVTVFLVLGTGFVALFAPGLSPVPFWVVGFAVLLPLVDVLLVPDELPGFGEGGGTNDDTNETDGDALATLKRRYAEGELTDAAFERRLERLLETEDAEAAEAFVERRQRERDEPGDREPTRRREPE